MRVMFYDETATEKGLAYSWFAGGLLYKAFRSIDICKGVQSWEKAFEWLATLDDEIDHVQFWGHGKPGFAFVDGQAFGIKQLKKDSVFLPKLKEVKARLKPTSKIWFRTCATFGCLPGQVFAKELANFFECVVAGHTYNIGPLQSGLHTIKPNSEPHWAVSEGLKTGTPEKPIIMKSSSPFTANTINCLNGHIPKGW